MYCLSFEASRISANVSKCVMSSKNLNLNEELFIQNYNYNSIYDSIRILEEKIGNSKLEVLDLKLVTLPFFYVINRIISFGKVLISPELQFYACRIEDEDWLKDKLAKIRKAEEKILRSGKAEKICKINELEGKMLGYPECCIENFVRKKKMRNLGKRVISPEGQIAEEFLSEEYYKVLDSVFLANKDVESVELPLSLFALNFYPCKLSCKKAKRIGEVCMERMEELGKERLFKAGVVAAMCNIMAICIKMKKLSGKNRDYCYFSPEDIIRFLI